MITVVYGPQEANFDPSEEFKRYDWYQQFTNPLSQTTFTYASPPEPVDNSLIGLIRKGMDTIKSVFESISKIRKIKISFEKEED